MAVNDKSTLLSEFGTLFLAPVGTPLPAGGLGAFKLTADTIDEKWKNIGHTSADNKVTISIEGGEGESLHSWLKKNLKTTYGDVTATINANLLQMDKETLKWVYNGTDTDNGGLGVDLAKNPGSYALVLVTQETQTSEKPQFGIHCAKTSITPDGGPNFTDNFVEQGLIAQIESPEGDQKAIEFLWPDAGTNAGA